MASLSTVYDKNLKYIIRFTFFFWAPGPYFALSLPCTLGCPARSRALYVLLAMSFFKGDYPSTILCLRLISGDSFVSHPPVVPHAAAGPRVSLQGGCGMLQLCVSHALGGTF